MKVDWTFPIWNIITAAVFLGAILYKLGGMEAKLDTLWEIFMGDAKSGRRTYDRIVLKAKD